MNTLRGEQRITINVLPLLMLYSVWASKVIIYNGWKISIGKVQELHVLQIFQSSYIT